MQPRTYNSTGIVLSLILAAALLGSPSAQAVPSFARQTGMACAACHTMFPELTPFGRLFKLNGYLISNLKTITDISMNRKDVLQLNETPPISFMFQTSVTSTAKSIPDQGVPGHFAQNDQFLFPQQASFFVAGKIAPKIGAFMQITYDRADDKFGFDNTDIRFADNLYDDNTDLVYGVTLNNNPTVQDVWNSTPAWGFPYAGSSAAPAPTAGTQLDGGMADAGVGGASAYFWWRNAFYGEAGIYRSSPPGVNNIAGAGPIDSTSDVPTISGVAPYWRFAYQHQWDRNSLEVGTYGVHEDLYPGGSPVDGGPTDKYTDVAVDAQYQFIGDANIFTLLSTYIHEDQTLDASSIGGATNPSDTLETFKIIGNYYYKRTYGLSLGYVNTWGTTDPGLYTDGNPVTNSANGSPDSDYIIAQLNYMPWLNTKFALQYTAYNKFNGAGSNYDGAGRSASDNNTLYVLGWFNF